MQTILEAVCVRVRVCFWCSPLASQPCLHKYLPRVAGHEIKTGNDVSDHLWRHTLKLTLLLFAGSQYLKTPTVAEFDTVCENNVLGAFFFCSKERIDCYCSCVDLFAQLIETLFGK